MSEVRDGEGQDNRADARRPSAGLRRVGTCAPNCGACCTGVVLNINPAYQEEDVRHWLSLHGIRLWERGGATWAWVPLPCRELQPDMKCGLFGKPERPKLCDTWPFNQEEIITLREVTGAECSYSFVSEGELE